MLVYWIPETICTIPINATHRIGVGAIVLTDEKEVRDDLCCFDIYTCEN